MHRYNQRYYLYTFKGDAYKHIPRTSTVASSTTGVPSVRSSERRDERRVNAFSTKCSDPYSHLMRIALKLIRNCPPRLASSDRINFSRLGVGRQSHCGR